MPSITISDVLTVTYVLVDDWYQTEGRRLLKGKAGCKPEFSDSEMMTLMLATEFIPFPSETQFVEYIRAHYLALFPKLIDQSQFNRRARALRLLVEEVRRYWLKRLANLQGQHFLLDTKPVPVVGYKRSKRHSDFAGSADYGRCVARQLKYFGYKLVMITDLEGLPIVYDLVSANTDEREAAEVVIDYLAGCNIFADKGFIGQHWRDEIYLQTGNHIWTPKRVNQSQQNAWAFDKWLNSLRERIEGTFNVIQNTGRNLERLLAKTVLGLATRVIVKVAGQTLRMVLKRFFGIDVQTFEVKSTPAF